MADPAPVAQTFFVDQQVKEFARLDGIVTLIDAKHVEQHLDEQKPEGAENEAIEQVAFADRLLLNKTDLVSDEDLKRVEGRLKAINANAPIMRCHKAEVSVDSVLNIGAFDLNRTLEMDPEFLNTDGEHEHDTSVSSVSITQAGELDLGLIEDWVGTMLREKGADIYRMKGVLNIRYAEKRFVYHAVHMIFNGEFMEEWGAEEERHNKLVFIGKNLDGAALREAFSACLVTPENLDKKLKALRFKVDDRVMCNVENEWMEGTITQLLWRSDDMDPGMVAPYQITLDDGEILSAPADEDHLVRKVPAGGAAKKARTS